MTKETEEAIRLFEKAVKYNEGLPADQQSGERAVGFYDCLCRVQPLVDECSDILELLSENTDDPGGTLETIQIKIHNGLRAVNGI